MHNLADYLDRAQLLLGNHLPAEVSVPAATGVAVGLLLSGLLVAVLGAKLARSVLTLSFALGGGFLGMYLGGRFEAPVAVTAALGAGVLGLLGFVMHRLWVGILIAAFLTTVVNATYGAQKIAPQLDAYQANYRAMPDALVTERFEPPAAHDQARLLNPDFRDWLGGFWVYLGEHDRPTVRHLQLVTACVALGGFLLSLFAMRFTLVTTTALVGTAAIAAGAASLAKQWRPDLYEAGMANPPAMVIACGTFLLGSIILQTLLTRPNRRSAKSAAP